MHSSLLALTPQVVPLELCFFPLDAFASPPDAPREDYGLPMSGLFGLL